MADATSVLLAGGGTAGHVNPLLAVADELRRRHPRGRFAVLGTAEGLEARLVPEHGYDLAVVPRVPLPRRPTVDWLRLPGRLRAAVRAAGDAIDEIDAQVVVGFGGYVATPAYLAARRRGIPVVVHEQNARPGLANRVGARWAAAVAVTFPGTMLPGAQVTGLPLRTAVQELATARATDPVASRRAGADALGLDPALPTLLVTGGSLGAASVNRAVAGAADALLATGAQVLHLTGRGKADDVRASLVGVPGAERYHVVEYLTAMDRALAVADVVVGRAGAGTVCELAALGIPAVYVPLPFGNGEQRLNAAGVVAAGGGLLVEDRELTPAWVRDHVAALLGAGDAATTRARMGRAAAGVGVRDGAARVADLVEAQLPAHVRASAPPPPTTVAHTPAVADPGERGPVALSDLGRVHLVGVGGAGMSAVAPLLAARGLRVSGSDAHDGPALVGLRAAGVDVHVGHAASHVEDVDTLVVSSAVRSSNPEVVRARERGLPVLHRSEALAALMADRDAIAVAGAHGKTTTSGMVAAALVHAGTDPSFAIGGVVRATSGTLGGARHGAGPFVAEADESDGSFLAYEPLVAVVTNVEPDHLDHYGTQERFEAAFERFADRVRDGGLLVACADDPGAVRLVAATRARLAERGVAVRTYGTVPDADVHVGESRRTEDGRWQVVLTPRDEPPVTLRLQAAGAHNALDAAAAWCALRRVGVSSATAAAGLDDFVGTGRRFEDRGTAGGVRVVDDYAHHPTEVAALLRAARQVADDGRVLALFQPHLYSRTRTFAREFGAAFDLADAVVVTDVYAAREDPDPSVTGALVADHVPTPGKAVFVPDRLAAAHAVAALARPGDLLLTIGAGDVTELADVVLSELAALGARTPQDPPTAEGSAPEHGSSAPGRPGGARP
ncbi:UDP-N-acetylmuramate--L-alanine ligase [Cellulomonas dongxiuzhuiae]|uniref:Multifunctional fusion protein n=1 Tax=Cellulomonas dongxiuzhuiae TaxID=2819979 RepID=A0ABX8GMN8_9CELL|nr:UDP-N-acetylmuramate--L-alanine ligase [Cellulomonas dongxiuzhuiae]MBO3096193.1 UDP-N-acetylmuramate--L-alanine ligase [Cellulomonas dongxiuzhuiae]QWC17457.1 UDP-N-acetylmuramate--L-alanine ligase [Cellulomonas dongxiuzhuiae]